MGPIRRAPAIAEGKRQVKARAGLHARWRQATPQPTYQQPASSLCQHGSILVFVTIMSSQRISQAMARIDAALARIETQAALAGTASGTRSLAPVELVERHEALRESVDASLAELDALIERLDR
jgi:hypothetical protein